VGKGSVYTVLYSIIDAVDDMGGTLGAIFGILLAALATALKNAKNKSPSSLVDIFAPALAQAVEALKQHTGARVGDRTVMDVLLPFAETLENDRSLRSAIDSAERAAENTKELKPSFGRASYVGSGGEEQKVPDPGAWALLEMLKGIQEASGTS
jgi:dihydroxyacetone kinase